MGQNRLWIMILSQHVWRYFYPLMIWSCDNFRLLFSSMNLWFRLTWLDSCESECSKLEIKRYWLWDHPNLELKCQSVRTPIQFLAANSLHKLRGEKKLCSEFWTNYSNKIFCRIYGLAMMLTISRSNICQILIRRVFCATNFRIYFVPLFGVHNALSSFHFEVVDITCIRV